jgi:hypothetical protein
MWKIHLWWRNYGWMESRWFQPEHKVFLVLIYVADGGGEEFSWPTYAGVKNILLSWTAREHWKFSANNQVNQHSDHRAKIFLSLVGNQLKLCKIFWQYISQSNLKNESAEWMRLTPNMIFGMCNIWVIRRRNVIYLYNKKSHLDQLFHCQSLRIWCH